MVRVAHNVRIWVHLMLLPCTEMVTMVNFTLYTLYHNKKKKELGEAVCLWGSSRVAGAKSCFETCSVSYQLCIRHLSQPLVPSLQSRSDADHLRGFL